MSNIQEKTLGYFTQEDWLEIKEYIKKVLKEDIDNVINENYIFDADFIRDTEKEYLQESVKEVVKEIFKEQDIKLKEIIREVIKEELQRGCR